MFSVLDLIKRVGIFQSFLSAEVLCSGRGRPSLTDTVTFSCFLLNIPVFSHCRVVGQQSDLKAPRRVMFGPEALILKVPKSKHRKQRQHQNCKLKGARNWTFIKLKCQNYFMLLHKAWTESIQIKSNCNFFCTKTNATVWLLCCFHLWWRGVKSAFIFICLNVIGFGSVVQSWPLLGPWYNDEARLSLASKFWSMLQLLSSSAVTSCRLSSSSTSAVT